MGKASRRQRKAAELATPKVIPAPFVARPFAGMPGEADWVAMREIVPAATARVRLLDVEPVRSARAPGVEAEHVTIATLLPASWPGLHRDTGELVVGLQSGPVTGDPSRDIAAVVLGLLGSPAGAPLAALNQADASTPRLQDILDLDAPFEVEVHDGFGFWVPDRSALDARAMAELEEADASIIPTVRMPGSTVPEGAAAYWCRVGGRTHIRLLLTEDEDAATDALARLHARGEDTLDEAGETRLLGAFRASGLLVPVWDLDPGLEAADYEGPLAAFSQRLSDALAESTPLDAAGRRAKSGLLSRQLTLR